MGMNRCSYVANMAMCNFALAATQLAAAGVSSLRFDHPMAVFSKSERKGPFRMGNHEDEVGAAAVYACRTGPVGLGGSS